jgi:hypothetical protein
VQVERVREVGVARDVGANLERGRALAEVA